jgi:hypothetical protein
MHAISIPIEMNTFSQRTHQDEFAERTCGQKQVDPILYLSHLHIESW